MITGDVLYGFLQVINNRSDHPFIKLDEDGAQQLCSTLGVAIRQRMQKLADSNNNTERKKAIGHHDLVADAALSQQDLTDCIQKARVQAETVEHLLMTDHQIRPAQIGPSLIKFFNISYEPFNAGRSRLEMLHGLLKRDFIEQQSWIPLEETLEGLLTKCVDPEAVRGSRTAPQVFSRKSKFAYCVTTQPEFEKP